MNLRWITVAIISAFLGVHSRSVHGQERYVAIGDGYSSGQGVSAREAFPSQFAEMMRRRSIPLELVSSIGKPGWTTRDILDEGANLLSDARPTLVTLTIGSNDWKRGIGKDDFRDRVTLLVRKVKGVLPETRKLLVISIPDFGVSPAGPRIGSPMDIARGVRTFNRILFEVAQAEGASFVDIYQTSLGAATDRSFSQADGLNPSGRQYYMWAKKISEVATPLFPTGENSPPLSISNLSKPCADDF